MKILVCMKQVPQKDAPLKLNESGTWIRDDVSYEVNEPDAFALEEALRQKEKHTGEVVVITAGPARSQQVLREGLAKGADRAIHLEDNGFVGLDAFNMAKAFVAAIKDEKFDLIFTGLQSDDYGYAQTGVIMAQLLGWPHATIIMEIQKTDAGIKVKRELESGFFQHVSLPLPAVLGHESAGDETVGHRSVGHGLQRGARGTLRGLLRLQGRDRFLQRGLRPLGQRGGLDRLRRGAGGHRARQRLSVRRRRPQQHATVEGLLHQPGCGHHTDPAVGNR